MRRDLQEEPESTIGSKPQHEEPEEGRREAREPERPYKTRWEEETVTWSPETRPQAPLAQEPIRK